MTEQKSRCSKHNHIFNWINLIGGGLILVSSSSIIYNHAKPESNPIVQQYQSVNNTLDSLYNIRRSSLQEFSAEYLSDQKTELSDVLKSCSKDFLKSIDSAIIAAREDSAKLSIAPEYNSYILKDKKATSRTLPLSYAGIVLMMTGAFLSIYRRELDKENAK
jgi:hypothetical protein